MPAPIKVPHGLQTLCQRLARKPAQTEVQEEECGCFDNRNCILSKVLEENGLYKLFPQYQEYEIQVDVVGIIHDKTSAHLSFIECKLENIILKDVSKLLGYSKVANPLMPLIISPIGVSYAVNLLLNVHRRYNVLSFNNSRSIRVARWLQVTKD